MRARLSDLIHDDERVRSLREALANGRFAGLTLEDAIRFARSDGILPKSDLPARSFLELEDWLRDRDPVIEPSRYLFVFGYETPAQRVANASHGWDDEDSIAFWVTAPSEQAALAWGREVAEAFVRDAFERAGWAAPLPSWKDDEDFESWIEHEPERHWNAEAVAALPTIEHGRMPVFPTGVRRE